MQLQTHDSARGLFQRFGPANYALSQYSRLGLGTQPMEPLKAAEPINGQGRNIVIFSDGTGQRGGVYFDEARTNVYKLFRATRVGPDTNIDPAQQLAFYDPGLGTQPSDGSSVTRTYRTIYNFVSQATGVCTENPIRVDDVMESAKLPR